MQSRRLWRESSPYYSDALQEMWEYCFLKLDDPDDGYNPDVCRVTTWLDDRLKKILRRYRDRTRRQLSRQLFAVRFEDGRLLDPVDSLVAPPDPQSALVGPTDIRCRAHRSRSAPRRVRPSLQLT